MKTSFRIALISITLILSLILAPVSNVHAITVPAEINKDFTPIAIVSGATSTLRVTVYNLNQNPLTNASWTDDLTSVQPGLSIADPPMVVNTCGGTVTEGGGGSLDAGDTSFQLNNGTVPAESSGFPGECYVEVDITSTTPGNLINTIPANELSSTTLDGGVPVPITNTTPASATINVIGVANPSLSKSFAPNTIFVGGTSTLTITVHNNDTSYPLNNVTLTDTLPISGAGEVVLASPVNANPIDCGTGTLTDGSGGSLDPGDTSVRLNGGTIAPDTDCTISVDVTSLVQGSYSGVDANTIPAGPGGPGSIQTREGVTNGSPASADLHVQAFTLTKAFGTSPIAAGDTSLVTITIQNHAPFDYTQAALDDSLPTDLVYVPGTGSTNCGGGVISFPAAQTVRLTNGTLPANSTCTITATAEALTTAAGPYTNDIPIGALSTFEGATNHDSAFANLDVTSITIDKSFSPTTFAAGQTSTLTIRINNPTTSAYTNASLSDTLPASPPPDPPITNLTFTGTPTTDCGAGSVAIGPSDTITMTNGTIPASSFCEITALVTTLPGAEPESGFDNEIPPGALNIPPPGPTNTNRATATVNVSQVSVNKTYNPGTVAYPTASLLTITIFNPVTGDALTDIELIDNLPPELEIAPYPPATPPDTDCDDSSVPSLTATALTQVIELDNGSLPAAPGPGAESCTITVPVRPRVSTSSGTYSNTIDPFDVSTNEGPGNGNDVTANLTVQAVGMSKSFQYANFESGGTNTVTITISNPTGADYTGVTVTDTLPTAGNGDFEVDTPVVPSLSNCGLGTLDDGTGSLLVGGETAVRIFDATVAAGSSCVVSFNVTSSTPGSYEYSPPPPGGNGNTIPATTLVTDQGPTNPDDVWANVEVYTVGAGVPSTKSFSPATINIFGTSTLTLNFTAPADTALNNFSVTDNLPANLVIANPVNANLSGCDANTPPFPTLTDAGGGSLDPGDTSVRLNNGSIAASDTCTVEVDVTSSIGSTPGIDYVNTIPASSVTNNESRSNPSDISDTLIVQSPPDLEVRKAFYPDVVDPGGLSTLTITLENSNTAALINVSLTDNLPGNTTNGVVIYDWATTPNWSSTCGGSVTFPDEQAIQLTGGTIPARVGTENGICTINVDVEGIGSPNTYNNVIPTTNVTADISGNPSTLNSNNDASDSLTIADLDLEIVKGFDPLLVFGGTDSEMTIILRNPNASAELVDITFTDNMPIVVPGSPPQAMMLSDPPNFDASDCDPPTGSPAVMTGLAGESTFTFSGGYLAPNDSCTITLNATMTVNGNLTNTIPAGAVTTFNGATNGTPTSATLTNLAGASIAKSFAPNPVASGLGSWSILTITIRTTATVSITGLGLVDNLPAGLQVAGGAAPAPTNGCGGTFTAPVGATTVQLVGGSLPIGFDNCFLTVPVTGANPGIYTNTIPDNTLISDQGVTNRFPATAQLTLTGYSLGNRVWFDTNNDGLLNGLEVGVSGVRVELYRDDGGTPGVYDSGDTYLSFENTDGSGHYRFDNLGGGDYVVIIPADNFRNVGVGDTVGADPLQGYVSSGTSMAANGVTTDSFGPDPDTDVDNDDNGVTIFSGNTVDYVAAQTVTLGPGGTEPINETDPATNPETGEAVDNQSNRTVDFGFYRLELGDLIFQDLDENGNFDGLGTDAIFPGARVLLFASDGTTEIEVGLDGILGTADDATGGTVSDVNGLYRFSGMPAGNYIVKVLPTGYPGTIDTFDGSDSADPNENTNNNDNGLGTGPGTTSSNVVTLTPGSTGIKANNTVTNSTGTTYDPTVDFGYITHLGKFIITTDASHTDNPKVAIGEIITYEAVLNIPVGGLTDVELVDVPQAGLAFVDCVEIIMPAGVSSTELPAGACDARDGTNPATDNPLIENSGGRITFDFGDISNTSGSSQFMRVQYTLIVLNVLANQDGGTLSNDITWTYTGGSRNTIAPLVEIVEPELTISKRVSQTSPSVGDIITFTIELTHPSPPSTADAFDVIVTDQVPSGLIFQTGSQGYSGSAALTLFIPPAPGSQTLTWVWDVFRLNETATITFNAQYVGPPPVVNSTNAEWTSLEIDPVSPGPPPVPVQLSPYNAAGTERWYDPAAPAGVNSYGASASVVVADRFPEEDEIPNTGFAPGKVTELSEQPLDRSYQDLGDLWLEIPSQGVQIPITGVPRVGKSWDVQWLWDQAGYLQGTAFPTWAGNSAITAHVFLPDGKPGPFVDLHTLGYGDQVIIHAYGQRYTYEVRSNRTVSPLANVFEHEEFPWVTLITCQGYDEVSNSYRYRVIVRAVQTRIEPE